MNIILSLCFFLNLGINKPLEQFVTNQAFYFNFTLLSWCYDTPSFSQNGCCDLNRLSPEIK